MIWVFLDRLPIGGFSGVRAIIAAWRFAALALAAVAPAG
jgi:hypothetical protein